MKRRDLQTLYIDESGDHNLVKIDSSYPVFVLGGVLVEDDYHDLVIDTELKNLKLRWFGTTKIILHTADIVRNRGPFAKFKEASLRNDFFSELRDLLLRLDVKILACAIHKIRHRDQYREYARDPYEYALTVLVERLCTELGDVFRAGSIVAERRSGVLDRLFTDRWDDLQRQGTGYVTARTIRHRISSCGLRSKSANIAGLQLADLVVSPIGRYLMRKENTGVLDFRTTVYPKMIKDEDGNALGYGLMMIPSPKRT